MKKKVFLIAIIALLVSFALAFRAFSITDSRSKKKSANEITGTWQLESYKYGSSSSSFTWITPNRPHIKLITGNRFLWVTHDTITRKILESAGGTYTLDNDIYTESIDYGYNMDKYLGSKSIFRIKIEDGLFYLSGTLSDGYKIEEIWQKIK